jgi:hypothetical protein
MASVYDVDWAEEFGRNKPATPRPPCKECLERESLGTCSACHDPLCDYCVDLHFEAAHQLNLFG